MDIKQLLKLIQQEENPVLEFKEELHRIYQGNEYANFQKYELIKDILSLANGSTHTAGKDAYLIFGVKDKKNEKDKREIVGINGKVPDEAWLINVVNACCNPRLMDLKAEILSVDGKNVFVITIPFSPHVHETTKKLNVGKTATYSEFTVFHRQNESVKSASGAERDALKIIKEVKAKDRKYVRAEIPCILFGLFVALAWGPRMIYAYPQSMEFFPFAGLLVFLCFVLSGSGFLIARGVVEIVYTFRYWISSSIKDKILMVTILIFIISVMIFLIWTQWPEPIY
jgi:hypothetical protein